MFYPPSKTFSDRQERQFARMDLTYNTTEDLLVAMEDQNITKTELAKRLGKSKTFVTQVLSGSRNMTLGTLSDIAFVLELKIKITFRRAGENAATAETKNTARILQQLTSA
ncbi:MAG: helix-turn-helix transcriptional regulator [Pseudomonadales bacterium]|jgi:transcriptional regulator with XRE-family HTH domain|nr:helix-turn-helix transcriptional regulator [Pseudomonadales bacterium]